MEITVADFLADGEERVVFDMRSEFERNYGLIPSSEHKSEEELLSGEFDRSKQIIVYCARGEKSLSVVEELRKKGYDAFSLKGGYIEWLRAQLAKQADEDYCKRVEHSIQKKFKRDTFSKFIKAIKQYELIKQGDKIAVCISGGKDSMLMAKLFQELKRHSDVEFDVEYIVMDPGYNAINRQIIEENARRLNVPITVYESNIFDAVFNIEKSPCYVCARMRRGYLYRFAKESGCNKIALGHHYDDVIETILMAMLYGAQIQTMMPKLHSSNFKGMELIRPMYFIREDDIKAWRDYNELHFIQCACKFTDTCTTCEPDGRTKSKRQEVKQLIKSLKENNPEVEKCIFRSVENVNLDKIIAYKMNGAEINFLDGYDENGAYE